jgi:hypothetical protein
MTEFIRGMRTPLSTTVDAGVGEDRVEQRRVLAVSVSDQVPHPAAGTSRSMTRFRAVWATYAEFGWVVAPRTRTRRVACSMTARTCSRAPVNVVVSKKSAARIAWAWERRNLAQVSLVR